MKASGMSLQWGLALLVLAALATAGCSATSSSSGDALRGEQVHAVCLDCHGTGVYTSAERKIKSLPALQKEVTRWGDYYDPALSAKDNEDVVAYLNTHYYKF
ncbi:c-type cytochrome [Sulfurimicrobium lacus]|nr:hypothetical protein [Sulfurimicrobium lacus]